MPTKKSTSTEKTKCPKCEAEIKKGWKFCNGCGRPIVCKCGEDISELKGDYCPVCGEKIQKAKAETVTKPWTPDPFIPRIEPKPWKDPPIVTRPWDFIDPPIRPWEPPYIPEPFKPSPYLGEPKPYPDPFPPYKPWVPYPEFIPFGFREPEPHRPVLYGHLMYDLS